MSCGDGIKNHLVPLLTDDWKWSVFSCVWPIMTRMAIVYVFSAPEVVQQSSQAKREILVDDHFIPIPTLSLSWVKFSESSLGF